MERWDKSIIDINASIVKLGDKCSGILGMHALSGCDTVSYPSGKGKASALKVLLANDMPELDTVLGEDTATHPELMRVGTDFFLALYAHKKSTPVNHARHGIYCKRKNPPALKSLPPTDTNLALHI